VDEHDLSALSLDVYESKQGLWNPEHGELELPAGWEFLPSGDTFVTKQVKAAGVRLDTGVADRRGRREQTELAAVRTVLVTRPPRGPERTAERRAEQRVVSAGGRVA
jgi:hypothetical protein